MARDRFDDECDINNLYGCPGADSESSTGIELLLEALNGFGLKAFTDEFITALAARHRLADEAAGIRADLAYRRSQRTGLLG
jgi:hypothetical protein